MVGSHLPSLHSPGAFLSGASRERTAYLLLEPLLVLLTNGRYMNNQGRGALRPQAREHPVRAPRARRDHQALRLWAGQGARPRDPIDGRVRDAGLHRSGGVEPRKLVRSAAQLVSCSLKQQNRNGIESLESDSLVVCHGHVRIDRAAAFPFLDEQRRPSSR